MYGMNNCDEAIVSFEHRNVNPNGDASFIISDPNGDASFIIPNSKRMLQNDKYLYVKNSFR
jgi:hypothetical protein